MYTCANIFLKQITIIKRQSNPEPIYQIGLTHKTYSQYNHETSFPQKTFLWQFLIAIHSAKQTLLIILLPQDTIKNSSLLTDPTIKTHAQSPDQSDQKEKFRFVYALDTDHAFIGLLCMTIMCEKYICFRNKSR